MGAIDMRDCQRWRFESWQRLYFCEVFLQYIFLFFVLCIHLVPWCKSLLMFVSNFSVYLITILIYLFTFLFIHLLILSIKSWISLLICLPIIYLRIYTVSKNSDFVIYLSTYLFVCLFITWIDLYLFTHLYIFTSFLNFFVFSLNEM